MSPKVFLDPDKYERERARLGDTRGRAIKHGEVATGADISRSSLDYLRRGQYSPSPETMAKLARFFGTSLDGLFTIRETPTR